MTKLILAAILFLTICSCGKTKPKADNDKPRIDKVCDQIMQSFSNGKFDEAFELLKLNSIVSPSTIDTLKATTADYAKNAFLTYGKIRSFEFVSEYKIKDFIAKRFYILKFDIYYLKFSFILYNNGDGWTITTFEYNEELMELLY